MHVPFEARDVVLRAAGTVEDILDRNELVGMLGNIDAIAWRSRTSTFKDRERSGARIEEWRNVARGHRADMIQERFGTHVRGSLECFALRVGEMAVIRRSRTTI